MNGVEKAVIAHVGLHMRPVQQRYSIHLPLHIHSTGGLPPEKRGERLIPKVVSQVERSLKSSSSTRRWNLEA